MMSLKVDRSLTKINHLTEVKINNCIYSKSDIEKIYIDQGSGIEHVATRIGVGRRKVNHILNKFDIPKSWTSEMTPRRLRVLRYIAYHQKKYKKSPMIKEIADKLAIPPCTVVYHIKKMSEGGYIKKRKYTKEITITDKGRRWCKNANTFNISSLEGNKRRKRGD